MAKPMKLACREREILRLAVAGKTAKEIATVMGVTQGNVNRRLGGIALKVGVKRQDVINWAFINPSSIKVDVRSEPALERGLHPPGCQCSSPYCVCARIIAA